MADQPAESDIASGIEKGKKLMDNAYKPRYAQQTGRPETRDRLMSALLGFRSGFEEAGRYIQQGNPIAATIAGIAGGLTGPTPQAVSTQRLQTEQQAQAAQFAMAPVYQVAPGLAEKYQELADMPMAEFMKFVPLIQRSEQMEERMKIFETTLGLRKEGVETSKGRMKALAGEREQRESERKIERRRQQLLDIEQRDPVIKKMREQEIGLSQVDMLIRQIQSGNSVAASALGTKMAKAMGEVGVLTESDVTRYITSRELGQGAADKLKLMMQGKPTEATVSEIGQIANVLKNSFDSKVQPRYDRYINSYAKIERMRPDDLANELGLQYGGQKQIATRTAQDIRADYKSGKITRAQALGELAAIGVK